VSIEAVWKVYAGEEIGSDVDVSDCFPGFRVGEVLANFRPDATDVWWTLTQDSEAGELATSVKSALSTRCLPLLDGLASVGAVFHFIREKAPLRHPQPFTQISWAIVCYLHGEVDLAQTQFHELESNAKINAFWRSRITDVRARLARLGGRLETCDQ